MPHDFLLYSSTVTASYLFLHHLLKIYISRVHSQKREEMVSLMHYASSLSRPINNWMNNMHSWHFGASLHEHSLVLLRQRVRRMLVVSGLQLVWKFVASESAAGVAIRRQPGGRPRCRLGDVLSVRNWLPVSQRRRAEKFGRRLAGGGAQFIGYSGSATRARASWIVNEISIGVEPSDGTDGRAAGASCAAVCWCHGSAGLPSSSLYSNVTRYILLHRICVVCIAIPQKSTHNYIKI